MKTQLLLYNITTNKWKQYLSISNCNSTCIDEQRTLELTANKSQMTHKGDRILRSNWLQTSPITF